MEAWFKSELGKAKMSGAKRIIVFQHISFYLKEPGEPDQYFNIPPDVRQGHYICRITTRTSAARAGRPARRDDDLQRR